MSETHHEFSPSRLEMLDICPGSYLIEKMYPKARDNDSPDALDGRIKHKIVEHWETCKDDKDFTNDQLFAAEKCVQKLEEIAPLSEWQREIKVEILSSDFDILNYGYIDAVYETDTMVFAFDWKFGRNKVSECHKNMQAINYAVGLIQKYNKPVNFTIYQEPLNFLTTHTFDESHIDIFYQKYNDIKRRSLDSSNIQFCASYRCAYCVPESCIVGQSTLTTSEIATIDKTSELTTEVLTDYYQKWKIVEKVGKNIVNTIKQRLSKGEEIQGFSLKSVSGNRYITDPQEMFNAINNVISVENLMKCINVNLKDLEAVYIDNVRDEQVKAYEDFKAKITLEGIQKENKEKLKALKPITKKQTRENFYNAIANYIGRGNDKIQLCFNGKEL